MWLKSLMIFSNGKPYKCSKLFISLVIYNKFGKGVILANLSIIFIHLWGKFENSSSLLVMFNLTLPLWFQQLCFHGASRKRSKNQTARISSKPFCYTRRKIQNQYYENETIGKGCIYAQNY